MNLGVFDEAIIAFDQSLAINPKQYEVFYNKGTTFIIGLGKYEEAIACFDQALAIQLHDAAFYNKGIALMCLDRDAEAIALFDKALAIKPDSHKALQNKGLALTNLGVFDEAIIAFDQSLAIQPDEEAFYNKGIVLDKLGRYTEAIAAYDEALALTPDKHQASYSKSCSFALSGKAELSIASLKTVISLDSQYREMAKTDTDFNNLRNHQEFQKLLED
jgi:tetratricopeptide (TPR) repeat protein